MKILIVTKHLDRYARSELFTRDFAFGLMKRGHSVSCYAWESGEVSDEMEEEGIEVVWSLGALSGRHSDSKHKKTKQDSFSETGTSLCLLDHF